MSRSIISDVKTIIVSKNLSSRQVNKYKKANNKVRKYTNLYYYFSSRCITNKNKKHTRYTTKINRATSQQILPFTAKFNLQFSLFPNRHSSRKSKFNSHPATKKRETSSPADELPPPKKKKPFDRVRAAPRAVEFNFWDVHIMKFKGPRGQRLCAAPRSDPKGAFPAISSSLSSHEFTLRAASCFDKPCVPDAKPSRTEVLGRGLINPVLPRSSRACARQSKYTTRVLMDGAFFFLRGSWGLVAVYGYVLLRRSCDVTLGVLFVPLDSIKPTLNLSDTAKYDFYE